MQISFVRTIVSKLSYLSYVDHTRLRVYC